jgi:hypothetical protein
MRKVIGSAFFPFVFLLTATAVWVPPLLPPVTQEQIAAWLTGGLSTEQIAFEIKSRGINFAPPEMVAALRSAYDSTIDNAVEVAQIKGEPQQLSLEETRSIDYLIESFHSIQEKQFATAQKNLI